MTLAPAPTCPGAQIVTTAPDQQNRRIVWCRRCTYRSQPTSHAPLLEQYRREHARRSM